MGWVIGLDVHKDTIAAAALNPAGELTAEAEFDNTADGHADLHGWIEQVATAPRCGLEPSGGVGHAAALFVQQSGPDVVLVSSRSVTCPPNGRASDPLGDMRPGLPLARSGASHADDTAGVDDTAGRAPSGMPVR